MRVNGLFGHIQRNNFLSLVLFAVFLVMLELLALCPVAIVDLQTGHIGSGLLAEYLRQTVAGVLQHGLWLPPAIVGVVWLAFAWRYYRAIVAFARPRQSVGPHLTALAGDIREPGQPDVGVERSARRQRHVDNVIDVPGSGPRSNPTARCHVDVIVPVDGFVREVVRVAADDRVGPAGQELLDLRTADRVTSTRACG